MNAESMSTMSITVTVEVGAQNLLACGVRADPQPVLQWAGSHNTSLFFQGCSFTDDRALCCRWPVKCSWVSPSLLDALTRFVRDPCDANDHQVV